MKAGEKKIDLYGCPAPFRNTPHHPERPQPLQSTVVCSPGFRLDASPGDGTDLRGGAYVRVSSIFWMVSKPPDITGRHSRFLGCRGSQKELNVSYDHF